MESHSQPQVQVELIGSAGAHKRLRVPVELDDGAYPTGVKVTDVDLGKGDPPAGSWRGELKSSIVSKCCTDRGCGLDQAKGTLVRARSRVG
jgi:hypothetical protein